MKMNFNLINRLHSRYSFDSYTYEIAVFFQLNGQPQYLNAELSYMLRISRYNNHFKFEPVTDEKVEEKKKEKKHWF